MIFEKHKKYRYNNGLIMYCIYVLKVDGFNLKHYFISDTGSIMREDASWTEIMDYQLKFWEEMKD